MKIAVASGKGGTGKTTIAVSLAIIASRFNRAAYVDCDVEEPDGRLFLEPDLSEEMRVTVPVPRVDPALCNGCGVCGEVCQYGAIAPVAGRALVFDDMCHGCGGCALFCPQGAITEIGREIGSVSKGVASRSGSGDNPLVFVEGRVDVGVGSVPPVIRAARSAAAHDGITVIDCPPGTACPMVSATRGCDHVFLVTEPTPFGLNDLILAIDTLEEMRIPVSVIINRSDIGDRGVRNHCESKGVPIVLEIPFSRHIASVCSKGGTLLEAVPALGRTLQCLLDDLRGVLGKRALEGKGRSQG